MNSKNLITKLALVVAIAALLFSVVTLIRSIVIGSGVLLAVILAIGTAIIVAICAMMLYALRGEEDDADDGEQEPTAAVPAAQPQPAAAEEPDHPAPARPQEDEDLDREVDELLEQLESDRGYDLHNFK